ncbi:hypothetical protein PG996_004255 [Apiospora saccharicola]|uniref:Secreted protein n=1 Tax=Apiospora saccharicola TaxID=335842 RepID=A0ABR1W3L7_9PEZI
MSFFSFSISFSSFFFFSLSFFLFSLCLFAFYLRPVTAFTAACTPLLALRACRGGGGGGAVVVDTCIRALGRVTTWVTVSEPSGPATRSEAEALLFRKLRIRGPRKCDQLLVIYRLQGSLKTGQIFELFSSGSYILTREASLEFFLKVVLGFAGLA